MKIFLIRHGDKQHVDSTISLDKRNVPLSLLGIKQIKLLGQYLSQNYPQFNNLNLIYSSPIARAVQTTEILKNILKIKEIKLVDTLEEFYITQDYSLTKDVREHLHEQAMINRSFDPLIKNILDFFQQSFIKGHKDLLISTHAALIRNTIYYLFPKKRPAPDKILESKIHHGGLTILNYDGQNFKLEKFDYIDYLGKLLSK